MANVLLFSLVSDRLDTAALDLPLEEPKKHQ
jgi:hypothetical protein